jgi:hypothetical protein
MRLLLPLTALLLASPAQAADRRYAIADFDRVVVEGPYTVRLTVGAPSTAIASGSPQALDAVTVEVQGMTLRIRRNRNAWSASPGRTPEPAVITLTTRNLRAARVIGSGSLDLSGARGLRVDLSVDGSGRLGAAAVQADALSVGLRGSGSITLAGRAATFTADIQGSGSLAGTGLTAENATIAATSSGEIALTVRRSATVTANGLGSVVIAGEPACTLRGPGASEVRCGRAR